MIKAGMSRGRMRLMVAFFLTSAVWADAQVAVFLKGDAEPKRGDAIRFEASSKNYLLTVGAIQVRLPISSVERVEIPKPAAMIEAEKMMADGQFASAIPLLEQVATDFAVLQWGAKADELRADAYARTGNIVKSLATYSELFKNASAGEIALQTRMNYWNTMLGARRFDALDADLANEIDKAPRIEAAHAQLLLGDVRRAQNRQQDAFLDYLRASLIYEDVAEVQPEALYKAAEMLDVLRDPRGAELRKRLAQKYPASEYARKAVAPM